MVEQQISSVAVGPHESNQHQLASLSAALPGPLLSSQLRWGNIGTLVGLGLPTGLLDGLQRQAAAWEREKSVALASLNAAGLQMPVSQIAWQIGAGLVVARVHEMNLTAMHPLLSGRLVEPYLAYSRFALRVSNELAGSSDARERATLSGTLAVLDYHAVTSAEVVRASITVPIDKDAPHAPIRYRLFSVILEELRGSHGVEEGMELHDLIAHSRSAGLAEKAQRIWPLMRDCNEAAKLRDEQEIFRITTRFVDECVKLPDRVATGREPFGSVVRALYILLYEAAGSGSLRYRNYMAEDAPRVILAIKHLRNYYSDHDADHGSDGDRAAKWKKLSGSLEWLGLARAPRSREDYELLHGRLLEEVERFLEELLRRIS